LFKFWTLHFRDPFGGLGSTYAIRLRLIGKHVLLAKLFLLGVTAKTLQARIDLKSAFCKGVGQYQPNFHIEGGIPHQSFLHGEIGQWMSYNFVFDSFHTK